MKESTWLKDVAGVAHTSVLWRSRVIWDILSATLCYSWDMLANPRYSHGGCSIWIKDIVLSRYSDSDVPSIDRSIATYAILSWRYEGVDLIKRCCRSGSHISVIVTSDSACSLRLPSGICVSCKAANVGLHILSLSVLMRPSPAFAKPSVIPCPCGALWIA